MRRCSDDWAGQSGGGTLTVGQLVTLAVRPQKLTLAPHGSGGGDTLTGTVQEVVYMGTDTRYLVGLASGETVDVWIRNLGERIYGEFKLGDQVAIGWHPSDARVLTD